MGYVGEVFLKEDTYTINNSWMDTYCGEIRKVQSETVDSVINKIERKLAVVFERISKDVSNKEAESFIAELYIPNKGEFLDSRVVNQNVENIDLKLPKSNLWGAIKIAKGRAMQMLMPIMLLGMLKVVNPDFFKKSVAFPYVLGALMLGMLIFTLWEARTVRDQTEKEEIKRAVDHLKTEGEECMSGLESQIETVIERFCNDVTPIFKKPDDYGLFKTNFADNTKAVVLESEFEELTRFYTIQSDYQNLAAEITQIESFLRRELKS